MVSLLRIIFLISLTACSSSPVVKPVMVFSESPSFELTIKAYLESNKRMDIEDYSESLRSLNDVYDFLGNSLFPELLLRSRIQTQEEVESHRMVFSYPNQPSLDFLIDGEGFDLLGHPMMILNHLLILDDDHHRANIKLTDEINNLRFKVTSVAGDQVMVCPKESCFRDGSTFNDGAFLFELLNKSRMPLGRLWEGNYFVLPSREHKYLKIKKTLGNHYTYVESTGIEAELLHQYSDFNKAFYRDAWARDYLRQEIFQVEQKIEGKWKIYKVKIDMTALIRLAHPKAELLVN